MTTRDRFDARDVLETEAGRVGFFSLRKLAQAGFLVAHLPITIKVLLEAALRQQGEAIGEEAVRVIAGWPAGQGSAEIPFLPARVVMQDFTGVPALVDLAAMRAAVRRQGGDPARVNPHIPVDLVIDHSVQVDAFGSRLALRHNADREFDRNAERYRFLKWGQGAFQRFRVVPPATGIVHQVNLEFLASVVIRTGEAGDAFAFPDTLVGTDSHTTMINGLGVVGFGVGGIEAEAVMLGRPLSLVLPEVIGVRLSGALRPGATATDLVLTVTELLRKKGVVSKFIEFGGPGLAALSLPDRATIANMAPEYGATVGFFPVDAETLAYLRLTGRSPAQIDLVERYCRAQGLFVEPSATEPAFSDVIEFDLGQVEPCMAGPKRPQDRVGLGEIKQQFERALTAPVGPRGFGVKERDARVEITGPGVSFALEHGAVVIAAITSCTNTSNPSVLVAAGLLAKKAVERGLGVPPWVKTSFAPGSQVVTRYLDKAGLTPYLQALRFHLVGYGCTTCIGNSGPLPAPIHAAVTEGDLVVAAVLSGNRNFEGRINPDTRANYLASPPLVVAYALAGTLARDLTTEPLGRDPNGEPVYLREVWPSPEEIAAVVREHVRPEDFRSVYEDVWSGSPEWRKVEVPAGELYAFEDDSTYLTEPPYFANFPLAPRPVRAIEAARVLLLLGDSITTDHISPAGDIPADSPAGRYLQNRRVRITDFNSYGTRRGNHEVMVRGTFANIRLKNDLVPGVEGGVTLHLPSRERLTVFEAALRYRAEGVPLVILAGREYGSGSSRDWAAKGTRLLGVQAVIAESFERIHRSNLVGMGVLPLEFLPGQSVKTHGLDGRERITIAGLSDALHARQTLSVEVRTEDGSTRSFDAQSRLDTPIEVEYYKNGGILETVLRKML